MKLTLGEKLCGIGHFSLKTIAYDVQVYVAGPSAWVLLLSLIHTHTHMSTIPKQIWIAIVYILKIEFRSCAMCLLVMLHLSLSLMNGFNKTEAAI